MRKFLIAALMAVALVGCTPKDLVVHDPATLVTPTQKVDAALDQAYATHAAVTTTLLQNYKDGVIDKPTKDGYAAKTKDALKYINAADGFFAQGDLTNAQVQLNLANGLIVEVQQALAKQAAKEKK